MTTSPIPSRVAHYEIQHLLGQGGMSVVYKARDTRLDRDVALKFLPRHLLGDDESKRAFLAEARAASALDHPNVCTIFELGETGDGDTFIAMACYEGETLSKRISRGPLAIGETLQIGRDVASGLAAAHARGIVHRDIKSANIMLLPDTGIKILDFGVAKRQDDSPTLSNLVRGTPGYMSPEQSMGRPVDQRTDLWALGVVLFECLTGQRPFEATSSGEVLDAVIRNPAPAVTELRTETPPFLAVATSRALCKDPEARFQTAQEMLDALYPQGQDEVDTRADLSPTENHPSDGRPQASGIAILPFHDLSQDSDQDYFCDGLTDELIAAIGQIPKLRVVSRTSVFRFKGKTGDLAGIGRALRASTILEGSLRKSGARVRITARLLRARDEHCLWTETFDRELDDIFAIQDEITASVVEQLELSLQSQAAEKPPAIDDRRVTPEPEQAVDKEPKGRGLPSVQRLPMETYHLYLRARFHLAKRTREGIDLGIDCLKKVVASSANHAPAMAALAEGYTLAGIYGFASPAEVMPDAKRHAERALELDPTLIPARTVLGTIQALFDWNWPQAAESFLEAIDARPEESSARQRYANDYLLPKGRFEEAEVELERALANDPLSLILLTNVGLPRYLARDYESAAAHYREVLEIDPQFVPARFFLGQVLSAQGRHESAIAELKTALRLSPASSEIAAALARAQIGANNERTAHRQLDQLMTLAKKSYVSPYHLALVHWAIGDHDQALDALEHAFQERHPGLVWLPSSPWFGAPEQDARVARLTERLKLHQ